MAALKIDPEFRSLIPPLTEEERRDLERNLVKDGCRDALVVWKETGILLDGHNRLEICDRLGIKYRVDEVAIADRTSAKVWILRNQLGRRNLTPFALAELKLRLKPLIEEQAKARQKGGQGRIEDENGEE